MATEVILPRVDMDMATVTLTRWYVEEGGAVAKGQPLFEIETDKAAMEVEAPESGILRGAVAAGPTPLPVGSTIAWIYGADEVYGPARATPALAAAPAAAPIQLKPEESEPTPTLPGGALRATPLARRLARLRGIDLRAIVGSGPQGRVQARDLPERAPVPVPAGSVGGYRDEPLSSMRKTIARRLSEAKREIPHFYLSIDCDLDRLLALRGEINARAEGTKVSVNDFVIRAVALALKAVPEANASFAGEAIRTWNDIDVAVAVATPGGLITPVIRRADTKSLLAISAEAKALSERARAARLKPEEYQGGGFTISNLGMYGIREFAAVINPPQACILAVGAAEPRPVVKDGALAVSTLMTCTLFCRLVIWPKLSCTSTLMV